MRNIGGGCLAPYFLCNGMSGIVSIRRGLRRTCLCSFCNRLLGRRRHQVCRSFIFGSLSLNRVTKRRKVAERNITSVVGHYKGGLSSCRGGLRLMRGFLSIGRSIRRVRELTRRFRRAGSRRVMRRVTAVSGRVLRRL